MDETALNVKDRNPMTSKIKLVKQRVATRYGQEEYKNVSQAD